MQKLNLKRCIIAEIGIIMIGIGVAFNAMAQLGNDPVGIFYDGIRNALNLTPQQLGMASNALMVKILGGFTGCLLLYVGVGLYIAMEIGLDPMNGISLLLMEKLKLDYSKTKWLFDGTLTVVGFILGGKLGVITLLTALTGGPGIQMTIKLGKKLIKE